MQFKVAALATLLAVVAAQDIATIVASLPSCSLACLTTAITNSGCSIADYACQCGTAKNAITKEATPCIAKACSPQDTLAVGGATTKICAMVVSSPDSGPASSSAASSSAPEASSSATSASPAAATSDATSSAATPAPTGNSANNMQVGSIMAGAAALVAFAI